jgi:hypothetical protein
MAAFYSSVPELRTISSSEEQRSSAAPKLRDSCGACASSKLKCHRQKPTCSRCAKRGITCSYVATRRKGRKRASQSSQSTTQERQRSDASPPGPSTNPVPPPLDMWFATDNNFSSEDYLAQSSRSTSGASASGASYSLPSDGVLPMQLSDLMTDFDDCFPLLGSPFAPDTSNCDFSSQTHSFFTDIGHGKNDNSGFLGPLSLFENTVAEPPSLSDIRTIVTNEARGSQIVGPDSCCVFQAMDLIKQLFPNSSSSCKYSEAMESVSGPSTTQNVLSTNQKTIEVVSEILQCSCSQDGFMLAIISLIIFKMLNWYAAAARQAPLWHNNPGEGSESNHSFNSSHQISPEQVLPDSAATGSPGLEGEDPAYMAAQRVLSELHCVQRLVNQLSTKLKEQVSRSGGAAAIQTPGPSEHGHGESSLPFSAGILDQLGVDLRRRLKSLSGEVVALLRRE